MSVQSLIRRQFGEQSVLRLYALQLSSYSGNALCSPYMNLYLIASGISASTLGIILSVGSLLEMALPPLLTSLADRHQAHRRLYVGFVISMVIGNVMLALFNQPILLAAAVVILSTALRPGMTLGLQLVITRMSQEGRHLVGRVRSFSSLGFGVASLLANQLFILGGYFAMFMGAAIAYASSLFLAGSLPSSTTPTESELAEPTVPRSRAFVILVISMFFIIMGQRTGYAFWFIHFQQHLDVSTAELAFIIAFMALVEIPFFILLDRVLPLLNVFRTFWVSGVGMALIWVVVAILPDKNWIYPLMIVRALIYSTFHLTTFLTIAKVSRPENVATNQALAQGTIPSLATLLTASISGWIYEYLGATVFLTTLTVVGLIGMVISIFAFKTFNHDSKALAQIQS